MTVQDNRSAAMLAHIISQVQSNVDFLVSQNYISRADASQFLSKLPTSGASNTNTERPASVIHHPVQPPTAAFPIPTPVVHAITTPTSSAPTRRQVPSAPQVSQARAIWGYNENNSELGDLSFAAGDIIEIVEETNADWWMGRVHGKQALFPSNYVEKIPSAPVPPVQAPVPAPVSTPAQEKPVYKPFGAAYHGMDAPPPPDQGVNSVGLQEQDTSKKKSKFSGLKQTMAHSAAGGVGFGAGAAIGSGLVNAIF
ncbi:hypothetical protein AX17_007404 [Amanita inopinata Kibby_2008]|nr:hypothetical protein AX17_007404 [Amanita inopinata Kibby_2008]